MQVHTAKKKIKIYQYMGLGNAPVSKHPASHPDLLILISVVPLTSPRATSISIFHVTFWVAVQEPCL